MENELLLFRIEQFHFGISIAENAKCFRAVEIISVPSSIDSITGVVNYHSALVPVLDIRKKLGIAPKKLSAGDSMIYLAEGDSPLIIVVDEILDVQTVTPSEIKHTQQQSANSSITGIFSKEGKDILMLDTHKLLLQSEIEDLNSLLKCMNKEI